MFKELRRQEPEKTTNGLWFSKDYGIDTYIDAKEKFLEIVSSKQTEYARLIASDNPYSEGFWIEFTEQSLSADENVLMEYKQSLGIRIIKPFAYLLWETKSMNFLIS